MGKYIEYTLRGIFNILFSLNQKDYILTNYFLLCVGTTFFQVSIADSKQSCTFAAKHNKQEKTMSKKETLKAIKEAKEHIASIKNGAQITEAVDLSNVDAMLKSCGV